jgi:putative CocE/NonD family hydrolase
MSLGAAALVALLALAGALALGPCAAAAEQEISFRAGAAGDAATTAAVRELAARALPVYQEPDRQRYLLNLSLLQAAAGDHAAAYVTRQTLHELSRTAAAARAEETVFDVYIRARALGASAHVPFAQALSQALGEQMAGLGDLDAYRAGTAMQTPAAVFERPLQQLLDRWRDRGSVALSVALEICRAYVAFDARRVIAPAVPELIARDDARRYLIDADARLHVHGASVTVALVLPRGANKPLPTLLDVVTEGQSLDSARASAAHGYVGVAIEARARNATPFEGDGEVARGVIEWIAKQSWSDGRVGIYGAGYGGFIAWAAAQHAPRALQALATWGPSAPGIDVPMGGGIFQNAAYRLLRPMTAERARKLDAAWYQSGRPYRDLDHIDGTYVPSFQRWLSHPSYDGYWQRWLPLQDLKGLSIPVLMMTGYYDPGEIGALYYFGQHVAQNATAEDTLLIGPYDGSRAYDDGLTHGGSPATVRGLGVDPAASLDADLRYPWFDYILKGRPKLPLLAAGVNYEVMGANAWRHVPTLDAVSNGVLQLYLVTAGDAHRLREQPEAGADAVFAEQRVDFADRGDAAWSAPWELLSRNLAVRNGIAYASEPLPEPLEISGTLSGLLDFTVNRQDMDLYLELYEQLPDGTYLRLFDPREELRASYARDRSHRHLLKAGERQILSFHGSRLLGRHLSAGSRLVLVLGINKRPDEQINYGSGGDVSVESIADAKPALRVRWYGDSYVNVPVRK